MTLQRIQTSQPEGLPSIKWSAQSCLQGTSGLGATERWERSSQTTLPDVMLWIPETRVRVLIPAPGRGPGCKVTFAAQGRF